MASTYGFLELLGGNQGGGQPSGPYGFSFNLKQSAPTVNDFITQPGDPDFTIGRFDPQAQFPAAAADKRLLENSSRAAKTRIMLQELGLKVPGEIEQIERQGYVDPKAGLGERLLAGVLDAPRKAIVFGAQDILTGTQSSPTLGDYWDVITSGFEDVENITEQREKYGITSSGSDLLKELGLQEAKTPVAKFARGVAHFATDVLLDPWTYITFGASAVGKKTLAATGKQLVKKVSREVVEGAPKSALAKRFAPVYDDALKVATRDLALEAGEDLSEEAVMELLERATINATEMMERQLANEIIGPLVGKDFAKLAPDVLAELPKFATGGARITAPMLGFNKQALTHGITIPGSRGMGRRISNATWRKLGKKVEAKSDIAKSFSVTWKNLGNEFDIDKALLRAVSKGELEGYHYMRITSALSEAADQSFIGEWAAQINALSRAGDGHAKRLGMSTADFDQQLWRTVTHGTNDFTDPATKAFADEWAQYAKKLMGGLWEQYRQLDPTLTKHIQDAYMPLVMDRVQMKVLKELAGAGVVPEQATGYGADMLRRVISTLSGGGWAEAALGQTSHAKVREWGIAPFIMLTDESNVIHILKRAGGEGLVQRTALMLPDEFLDSVRLNDEIAEAIKEMAEIGRKRGIPIPDDFTGRVFTEDPYQAVFEYAQDVAEAVKFRHLIDDLEAMGLAVDKTVIVDIQEYVNAFARKLKDPKVQKRMLKREEALKQNAALSIKQTDANKTLAQKEEEYRRIVTIDFDDPIAKSKYAIPEMGPGRAGYNQPELVPDRVLVGGPQYMSEVGVTRYMPAQFRPTRWYVAMDEAGESLGRIVPVYADDVDETALRAWIGYDNSILRDSDDPTTLLTELSQDHRVLRVEVDRTGNIATEYGVDGEVFDVTLVDGLDEIFVYGTYPPPEAVAGAVADHGKLVDWLSDVSYAMRLPEGRNVYFRSDVFPSPSGNMRRINTWLPGHYLPSAYVNKKILPGKGVYISNPDELIRWGGPVSRGMNNEQKDIWWPWYQANRRLDESGVEVWDHISKDDWDQLVAKLNRAPSLEPSPTVQLDYLMGKDFPIPNDPNSLNYQVKYGLIPGGAQPRGAYINQHGLVPVYFNAGEIRQTEEAARRIPSLLDEKGRVVIPIADAHGTAGHWLDGWDYEGPFSIHVNGGYHEAMRTVDLQADFFNPLFDFSMMDEALAFANAHGYSEFSLIADDIVRQYQRAYPQTEAAIARGLMTDEKMRKNAIERVVKLANDKLPEGKKLELIGIKLDVDGLWTGRVSFRNLLDEESGTYPGHFGKRLWHEPDNPPVEAGKLWSDDLTVGAVLEITDPATATGKYLHVKANDVGQVADLELGQITRALDKDVVEAMDKGQAVIIRKAHAPIEDGGAVVEANINKGYWTTAQIDNLGKELSNYAAAQGIARVEIRGMRGKLHKTVHVPLDNLGKRMSDPELAKRGSELRQTIAEAIAVAPKKQKGQVINQLAEIFGEEVHVISNTTAPMVEFDLAMRGLHDIIDQLKDGTKWAVRHGTPQTYTDVVDDVTMRATEEQVELMKMANRLAEIVGINPKDLSLSKMTHYAAERSGFVNPSMFAVGGKPLRGMEVEANVAKWFEQVVQNSTAIYTPLGVAQVKEMSNNVIRWWKGMATVSRPTFHVRNTVGGVWNNMIIGVRARDYLLVRDNAIKVRKYMETMPLDQAIDKLGNPKARRLFHHLYESGLLDASFSRAEYRTINDATRSQMAKNIGLVNPFSPDDFALIRGGALFMESVEDFLRASAFAAWIDLSSDASARATREVAKEMAIGVHFDYKHLTEFETKVKRFVPFFVWTRRNVPLQLQTMIERPGMMTRYLHLQTAVDTGTGGQEYDEFPGSPFWSAQAAGTGVMFNENTPFWARMVFDPQLPVNDLLKLDPFEPQEAAEHFEGLIGPWVTLPFNLADQSEFGDTGAPAGMEAIVRGLAMLGLFDQPKAVQMPYSARTLYQTIFPWEREITEGFGGAVGYAPEDPYRRSLLGLQQDESSFLQQLGLTMGKGLGLQMQVPGQTRGAAFRADELISRVQEKAFSKSNMTPEEYEDFQKRYRGFYAEK